MWRGEGGEQLGVGGSRGLGARSAVLGGMGMLRVEKKTLRRKPGTGSGAMRISQATKECHREVGPRVWSATWTSMTPTL